MQPEPIFDLAHLGHMELLTPKPDESLTFFVDVMGMTVSGRKGDSVYLRGWDDYERYSLKLTASKTSGMEHMAFRTRSPQALERRVAAEVQPERLASPARRLGTVPMLMIASMVLLSLGYQLHFNINSAPFYLRFAKSDDLQWLMPVFWIGFNIAMFPASIVVKHRGGLIVMGAAGLLGAFAIVAAEIAGSLNVLIVAQFMAGAAWGCMLMSAVSAALAIGETGAEGKVTGLVFSALALATFARMTAVAGGLQKLPDYAPLVHWAPVACWSVAGAGLLVIAASRLQRGVKSV
ncbi:MAG TPA: hypothetical protein DEH75_07410 [Bradyrhizobium sp.]|nr:hypothetical protein [Bradyrhizobium sp.]